MTKAQYEVLIGSVKAFATNLRNAPHYGELHRLYKEQVEILQDFVMPDDVLFKFETEIDAIFDAAYFNRPIPTVSVPITYTVKGDTLVVVGLRKQYQTV